jgi:5'-3' exonuclease
MDKNILIDGNNLLHRAHAIFVKARDEDPFISKTGYPTGLIYGCLSMLSDWLPAIANPTRALFFLDGVPKRRRDLDPTYKVKEDTEEIWMTNAPFKLLDGFEAVGETEIIAHILQLFGVDSIYDKFEEADDLIASYVKSCSGEIHVIMSSDKDFYQIVSDTTILYRPGVEGNRFFDAERAEEHMYQLYKAKVPPASVRMFKALTGDSSDGIVGVPRLRKKVAAPLCGLPSVDAVYATGLPGFSKVEKEKAESLREKIRINFELTGLVQDIDVESMRQHLEPNPELALKILHNDFQIYGVDPQSFRFCAPGRVRVEPAVPVKGLMPAGFLDDI